MRDTERETETQAEGEAGSRGDPDVGFDPRTPGSRPEPKAGAQPLSHPGVPIDFPKARDSREPPLVYFPEIIRGAGEGE